MGPAAPGVPRPDTIHTVSGCPGTAWSGGRAERATAGPTAERTDVGEAGGRTKREEAGRGQGRTRGCGEKPGWAGEVRAGQRERSGSRRGQGRRMTGGRRRGRGRREGRGARRRLSAGCRSVRASEDGRPRLRPRAASPSLLPQPVSEETLQLNQNYLQDNGPLFALRQMSSVGTLCFTIFLCSAFTGCRWEPRMCHHARRWKFGALSPARALRATEPGRPGSLQAVAVQAGPPVFQPLSLRAGFLEGGSAQSYRKDAL